MFILDTPIGRFFKTFQHDSEAGDIPGIVSHFADAFMAANPHGAQCVRAADFALALPKRFQLFKSLGCESTVLVSLEEIPLDNRFVMAQTRWRMTFRRDHREPVEALADSLFIVDTAGEPFKIVFYLAHQDHIALLRNSGLLPTAEAS